MMKPEHTKEFNAEHAKAGAPYCQRNGLAARIGIWDGQGSAEIIGERLSKSGSWITESWNAIGETLTRVTLADLVMLPLGYCEGKPVFVGDKLKIYRGGKEFIASEEMRFFGDCEWPSTAPAPHIHKALMDEAKADPSIEWEMKYKDQPWTSCLPLWSAHYQYRKKPKTVEMWKWAYKRGTRYVETEHFYRTNKDADIAIQCDCIKIEGSRITVEVSQ